MLYIDHFVSKNARDSFHIFLLAGTNDLSRRQTQPINLIDNLIESLDEVKVNRQQPRSVRLRPIQKIPIPIK